ncbi:MAG: hypothetical protein WKF57_01325 [Nakamurella sp.]
MMRKKIQSLGLVVVMAVGMIVGSTSAASAAPAREAAAPAAAEVVVLSISGEQIAVTATDLREIEQAVAPTQRAEIAAPRVAAAVGPSLTQIQISTIRLMWVNPLTVAKCILEIGSFIFGSAGKLAYIGAKIMKVVNKSAKLKALLKKVGGIKAALKGLWDKLKHKKMSAKHRADVDGFWKGLAKQAGSIAGIGNCLSLF